MSTGILGEGNGGQKVTQIYASISKY